MSFVSDPDGFVPGITHCSRRKLGRTSSSFVLFCCFAGGPWAKMPDTVVEAAAPAGRLRGGHLSVVPFRVYRVSSQD